MGKNSFIERQRIERQAYFDAGLQMGRQQILDGLSVVLNDPAIMRKDVFGKDRLLTVVKGIGEFIDAYERLGKKMMKRIITKQNLMRSLKEFMEVKCTIHSTRDMNTAKNLTIRKADGNEKNRNH